MHEFASEEERLSAIRQLIAVVEQQASEFDMKAQARIRKYKRWLRELEREAL